MVLGLVLSFLSFFFLFSIDLSVPKSSCIIYSPKIYVFEFYKLPLNKYFNSDSRILA